MGKASPCAPPYAPVVGTVCAKSLLATLCAPLVYTPVCPPVLLTTQGAASTETSAMPDAWTHAAGAAGAQARQLRSLGPVAFPSGCTVQLLQRGDEPAECAGGWVCGL